MRNLASLAVLVLLLAGCGEAPEPGFFPLVEDWRWEYDVVTENAYGRFHDSFEVHNVGAERNGEETRWIRRTGGGTDYHFRVDEDGIRRVAKRLIVELEPQPDFPERLVLPAPIETGRLWQNSTHPYLLRRMVSDGVDIRRGHAVPMSYEVAATDETVEVPAGRFEDCVKVVGTAELQIYVDGPSGLSRIPLTTEEWYARGVGLVRLVRTEQVESDMMTGGRIVMELARLERD